jgi:hypothetical protein
MTATTVARVEVLTAEVRVLMVGSRQVTLSVYAQLDTVKPDEIEPFGRVAPRNREADTVYVIGASAREADRGTLVRASRDSAAVCLARARKFRAMAALAKAEAAQDRERVDALRRADDGFAAWQLRNDYHGWSASELADEARDDEHWAAEAARWEALPLIVLAGLR